MNEPRQRVCQQIGTSGCYFLCIIHLAETMSRTRIDAVELYNVATSTGVMEADCFVNDPAKLLMMMVPGRWQVDRYGMAYSLKDGEYEITRYERKTTVGVLCHFVVSGSDGNVVYDPLGGSQCVMQGKPVSKRIFRKMA